MYSSIRLWLFTVLLLVSPLYLRAQDQNYPVTITPFFIAPESLEWSDFYGDRLVRLSVVLKDNAQLSGNVKLFFRFRLERVGIVIENTADFVPSKGITVNFGTPLMLSGKDLSENFLASNLESSGIDESLFRQGGQLPDGMWTLKVRAYEYDAARGYRALSNESSATLMVYLGQPPLLTSPHNGSEWDTDRPNNLLFQWTPRASSTVGGLGGIAYQFELWELGSSENENDVASGKQPILSEVVNSPLFLYDASKAPLVQGKRYAWRVKVIDANRSRKFENEGYSEVWTFRYGLSCPIPSGLQVSKIGSGVLHLAWNGLSGVSSYQVRWQKSGEQVYSYQTTNFNFLDLNGASDSNVDFEVRSLCKTGEYSDWSEVLSFVRPQGMAVSSNKNPVNELSTVNSTSSTSTDPLEQVVSSATVSDGDLAGFQRQYEQAPNVREQRCGGVVISQTSSCEIPQASSYGGAVPFNSSVNSTIYINGYEIVITKVVNDQEGEGLLYFPYLGKRIPVEWKGVSIREGEQPTYGCIVSGTVQAQGSNSSVLGDDLKRQYLALYNNLNNPGSFTGTFGQAIELMKQLATELSTKGTIDKKDPKLIQFKNVCSAVKKGTTDWKYTLETTFGKPSILQEINDLYTKIDDASAQLVAILDCDPTGYFLPQKRDRLNEIPIFYAKAEKKLAGSSLVLNPQLVILSCNFNGTQTVAQILVNGVELVKKLDKNLNADTYTNITENGKTYSCSAANGTKAIIEFPGANIERTTRVNPPIYTINNKKYQCFWSNNTVFGFFEVSKLESIKGKENALNLKKIGSYTPFTVISYEPNSASCKLKADDFDPNSQGDYFTEAGLNQLKNKLNGQGASNTEITVKDCTAPTKGSKTVTRNSITAISGQKPIQIQMCWDGTKWQLTHKFQTGALSIPSGYNGSVAEVEAQSNAVADRVKETGLKASSYDDELVYKDLDIIQALVEVKEATLTLCNQAKVPEKYWDISESSIKAPTLSGVGDGAIAELKDIPELVGFGLQLATEPETAKGIWKGIKSMTPAKVKKMLLGAASEKLAKYAEGGNTMKHEVGKDGVQAAMFVFGSIGKIKDGAELIDDLGDAVVSKLDEMADESLGEISKAIEEIGGKSFNKALKEAEIDNFVAESYASTVADVSKTKGRKLTWDEVKALFKRGNDFNAKARDEYLLNEIVLANKKRLDSYIPGKEIISRKATTLSEIKFETFENYLKELTTKYRKGTVINSSKTSGVLDGEYMLEIPTSNKNFAKLADYEKFAKDKYNVIIKYLDE